MPTLIKKNENTSNRDKILKRQKKINSFLPNYGLKLVNMIISKKQNLNG